MADLGKLKVTDLKERLRGMG
eukprot:SAG11_NODE_32081_length_286_cov_1.245989_1_plen_20_part_10